ncbi:MAG: hypothetical protein ACYCP0_10520 [Acidiferrobacteraceae bacterium]
MLFEVPPLVVPLVLSLLVVPPLVVPLLGALALELVDGVLVDEVLAEGAVVDVPVEGVLEEACEPELLEW